MLVLSTLSRTRLGVALALLAVAGSASAQADRYPLVPWPAHLEARDGTFVLTASTRVLASGGAEAVAEGWAAPLRLASLLPLPVGPLVEAAAPAGTVAFVLDPAAGLPAEGYRLDASPEAVVVTATTEAGLFYGAQTLRQLLPPAAERGGALPGEQTMDWTLPAVAIEDAPRFGWRGLHLDVARHFMPVEFVKRHLDEMARFKLNRFHWHLTDDQGWRIEIRRYPRLTEVGAWRSGTLLGTPRNVPTLTDTVRTGGFYTQAEIREVVAYAAARHITVVPEIELPGHAVAALAAYPELACSDGPFEVATGWGVFEDVYCPTETTFSFLEGVLTEVLDLFPGPYVHIGGDEVPKAAWEVSAEAQAVIQREGLADEAELQSYVVRRVERFLNAHGRRLVGWDEIVEGGLSPTATLMYWRSWSEEPLRHAAAQGNDVVMTPNGTLYFDAYQADPATEPLAIGGLTTLEEVYAYEPVPAFFSETQVAHVLGAQANVWTEYLPTPQAVEYMVWPRALALAEVVWSPAEARDWASFRQRLPAQMVRLRVRGVRARPLDE